jgi:fibronectin-binding autotransporter adhesin
MHMQVSGTTLQTTKRVRVMLAAIAAIVGLWALTPSVAHASGCTNSWKSATSGSWFEGANWSKGTVPAAEEEVCITVSGTYTVTLAQTTGGTVSVGSLTVGGETGAQTLVVGSTCSANAALSTTSGLANGTHGAVTLTNSDGCGDSVTLSGPITNAGTLTSEPAHGGQRTIQGNLTNTGTLAINVNTSYNGKGAALANEGALDLAEGTALTVSNEGSVTNGAGGKIAATGSADVLVGSGTSFTEGAGTTSGTKPVIVDDATLIYTGTGASTIALHGASKLSGNLAAAQSLSIESTCGENVTATTEASFTNAGSITLTNSEGCGNNAALAIAAGTLTNSGKLTTEPAHGGQRTIQGNITNTGTLAIKVNTSYNGKGAALDNEGALNLAEGIALTVSNEGSVTNGSGGSISGGATSDVTMGSGTKFVENAGTTTGTKPVIVDDATLSYTGAGKSLIALHGASKLSGSLAAAQSLSIESTCGEHATATAEASFTNAGSITLTNSEGCGNNATLTLTSGTLTNTGKIATEVGVGGARTLQGNLTNTGTLTINANTAYNGAKALLSNEGAINVAEGKQLTVSDEGSVVNGAGGKVSATAGGDLFMGSGTSFSQGAGTTAGGQPVIVDDATLDYTGTGASLIALRGTSTLSGNLAAEQSLTLQSTCGEHATITAGASFTNAGTITLTNTEGCGNNETLTVSSGTLTNTGKIITEPGVGGARTLAGNLTNKGTITIKANTTYNGAGAKLINEGPINIASGVLLTVTGSPTVTNAAGGVIGASGSGAYFQTGGTFNEGLGATTGLEPVVLDDLTLNETEHGSGPIALRGTSTLTGDVRSGQELTLESTCGEHATITAAGSFFSFGTIEFTNAEGCGNNVTLNLKGGTFTNGATLSIDNPHGGVRQIEGNVINNSVVSLAAGETLKVTGNYTQGAAGRLKTFLASSSSFGALSVSGTATLAGDLVVRQTPPFKGSLGESFPILSGATVTGTFAAAVIEDQINFAGLYYKPTYSSTGMTLVVTQATLVLSAKSGAPGSTVTLTGSGYLPGDQVTPTFTDHKGTVTTLPTATVNASGELSEEVTIPAAAALGTGTFKATTAQTGLRITDGFNVT